MPTASAGKTGRGYGQGPEGFDSYPTDESGRKAGDAASKVRWACETVKEQPHNVDRLENYLRQKVFQGLRDGDLSFILNRRWKEAKREAGVHK